MAIRILDELRSIKQIADESAIRKAVIDFFDEMDVDDVDKRTLTAISLEQVIRNIFMLVLTGELAREELINRLITEYSMIIVASGYRPNYAHIERVCEDIVNGTFERIETPYTTSSDRSVMIAETETNNAANYDEFAEALENGLTMKTWHTMKDNKVRHTHSAIDETTIGIGELFSVGDAEMRFPCDEELAYDYPEESVNCRCTVTYS